MTWKQFSFEVERADAQRAEDALEALGALSVTLADAGDDPILEPGPGRNPLWSGVRLTALFDAGQAEEPVREAVRRALDGAGPAGWLAEDLSDQPWERAWLADFAPMRFGPGLWIVPTGCEAPEPDAVNLLFDPGLAFGTGTHPTTALCLEWLSVNPPTGRYVIDYGCGSGVLAVAALRLGAAAVVAIDNDPQALTATRENARRNGVEDRLTVQDTEAAAPAAAPLVLANILSGVLIELAPTLDGIVADGGQLVLSGILDHQADAVARAYAPRFVFECVTGREGWVRLDGRTD